MLMVPARRSTSGQWRAINSPSRAPLSRARTNMAYTGKVDNCIVTVHLGYAAGDFHGLLDSDLFVTVR